MNLQFSEVVMRSSVITISGIVGIHEARALREHLDTLFDGGLREFVIDLSGTESIDSSGLAALARLLKHTRLVGGDVRLILPRMEKARRMFEITRFDRLFPVVDAVAPLFPTSAEFTRTRPESVKSVATGSL